ncbi:MAG: hypothetical protein P857_200 [Candidatus Xenolissoclinum pacificiensis L6]|uniref:Uncharacterized protein n=1 Tax=Candidatus Xenolissoclinum pacificiensis L6 TaxID=1401685 RepID=W2V1L1_9RICK|nr:MAG: hypothetical protein P857_200 [Candidatus Xenolissoclinum pacificiensis L6]
MWLGSLEIPEIKDEFEKKMDMFKSYGIDINKVIYQNNCGELFDNVLQQYYHTVE